MVITRQSASSFIRRLLHQQARQRYIASIACLTHHCHNTKKISRVTAWLRAHAGRARSHTLLSVTSRRNHTALVTGIASRRQHCRQRGSVRVNGVTRSAYNEQRRHYEDMVSLQVTRHGLLPTGRRCLRCFAQLLARAVITRLITCC